MRGRCCAWAGLWSTSGAARSAKSRGGSRWISTTPSTRSMAASSCACSTLITTNTASSRSSSSMARAASSPPCCARRSGRRASRSAPFCVAWCGRSAAVGRGQDPPRADRPVLRLPGGPRLVRGEQSRLHPRPRPQQHAPPTYHRPGERHDERFEAAPSGGKVRRFKEFFDARQDLEPGPPHRRPRRGRRRRHRQPLHRHQPRPRQRPFAVSGTLLPAWPRPRRTTSRPGKPISPPTAPRAPRPPPNRPAVPARRRLLATVKSARADAEGLVLARRPVRHAAAALIDAPRVGTR